MTSSTDTQPQIVLPNPRRRWWAVPLAAAGFAALAVVALAGLLPASLVADKEVTLPGGGAAIETTPYALVPRGAQPVGDRVRFDDLPDDVPVFPSDGDIFFVTISEPTQSLLSWWIGEHEPVIFWMTELEKFGGSTPTEQRERNLQMMATSEDVAKYVALTAAGYDAEVVPLGLEVESMVCLGTVTDGECDRPVPSAGFIRPGDVIVSAAGVDVMSTAELTTALEGKQPGDTIELTVRRGDRELTEQVELTSTSDDPGRAIVGFRPFEPFDIELPFEIDIDTGAIGGPSAGAAFTITLLDELTEGELTPGDVAITGTIALDGSIGAIGGLAQKAEAVRQQGVDLFLVPAGQSAAEIDAARTASDGDVEVVPVANLDEALVALEARGGDAVVPAR